MSELALQLIAEAKATNTKVLDLGNCGLTELPDELFELTQLEELNLCNRYWDDISKKWVESTNKGKRNRLTISGIGTLKSLKVLRINGDQRNRFKIYAENFIEDMTNLKTLDISFAQISNIFFVQNLAELEVLNLSNNQISDISYIEDLYELRHLTLNYNLIIDYKPFEKLTKLRSLDLEHNEISHISHLGYLPDLKVLNLKNNNISYIDYIGDLSKLQTIDISDNEISDISFLQNLIKLKTLKLSWNQISNIAALEKLSSLQTLHLGRNQISNISFLEKLTDLNELYIGKNPIEGIDTYKENKNYIEDVKEYFARQAEKNKVKVQLPVKVILLGNHASGKSTFTNFFVHNQLQSEDSTHILRIVNYPTEQDNQLPEAVIFDFGGQDYYHGLYRIYLSNQAINLIFWREIHNHNAIVEQDSNGLGIYNFNLDYWLAQKAYFERDSEIPDPAFLIKTHTDESHKETVPQTSYTYEKHFDCCLAVESEDHINRDFIKDTLKKEIEILRQKNASKEPQWYIDFLTFLYNHKPDNPFEPLTFEYILDSHYDRSTENEKIKIDFLKVNLRQLHNSGIILFYDVSQLEWSETSIPKTQYGLVWTNPSALVKKLHQEIFSREKLLKGESPGVTTFEELGLNPKTDAAILQMLKIQKIIFYHKNEKKYIIPNFLKLSTELDGHYHDLKSILDFQFTLQFKHFIPFGLINELMCNSDEHSEKFCRNGIIFTIQNVKISIELHLEKLQIEVSYLLKDPQQKRRLDRHLFLIILTFYSNLSLELPEYQLGKRGNVYRLGGQHMGKAFTNFDFFSTKHAQNFLDKKKRSNILPDDLFITTDKQHFVKFQDLNIEGNEILAYDKAANSLNKNISKAAFNSFMENPITETKKIFVSYAKEDAAYVEQLKKWLIPLLRKKHIKEVWTDNKILPGQNWEDEIEANLKSADIVFLLISNDFYASNYIYEKELPIVKERYEANECTVIPILIRPSAHWSNDEWKNLQAIPTKDGNLAPISKWADKDDAWNAVIEAIKKIL